MYWLQQVLWVAGTALAVALAAKLAATGLFRVYPWFTAFLCFEAVRSMVLLAFRPNTTTYGWIFLATQPLIWLLYILVVLELYSVALRDRRGLASLSRWALSACMTLAVAVSALTLRADLSRPAGPYPVLVYYSVIERGLIFSLALFLLLIAAFMAWFPLAVTRNVRLHASVYAVYFLSSTMALFLRNVAGYSLSPGISLILLFVDAVCLILWLGGLSRRGEEQLVTGRRWQQEDEQRLLRQLDALNAAASKRPRE